MPEVQKKLQDLHIEALASSPEQASGQVNGWQPISSFGTM